MIRWMVEKIAKTLMNRCIKKGRVFYITGGNNGDGTVYLIRYIVFKSQYMCLYIHRFMRSDSDDPHDHPWNFFTYVISGGYSEVTYDRNGMDAYNSTNGNMFWHMKVNYRRPGSIAYRRCNDIHQVVVDKARDMGEVEEAPLTVCLMGPRKRQWGFWLNEMNGAGFLDWREYLHIPVDKVPEGNE